MNKLIREHAAWRAYTAELVPDPFADCMALFDLPRGPKRALNKRVRPRARRKLPRHVPLGATLLRRLHKRVGKAEAQTPAAVAALRVIEAE